MTEKLFNWIKKNKYLVTAVVLVIIIAAAWSGRKPTPIKKIETVKLTTEDYKIAPLGNKVEKVNWKNEEISIPENTSQIENRIGKIGTVELLKLGEWLGATNMAKNIDNYGLLSYKDKEKGNTIYVNQDDNVVHFNRGYMGENYYQKTISDQDILAARKDFEILSGRLATWINGGVIKFSSIYYQKIEGPRALTAEKSESNVINIEADVIYNDKKLYTSYGASLITARYGSGGVLLELKIENPRLNLTSGQEVKLLNWKEIKKLKTSEIKVFAINGTQDFERSQQEDNLTEINVTSVSLGYLYSPAKSNFVPFLIGEGNCQIQSGPARVKLGVLLIK